AEGYKSTDEASGDSIKSAIGNFEKALRIWQSLSDRQRESDAYFSLGYDYFLLQDAEKTIEYLNKSLSIRQSIGDRLGEAKAISALGNVYSNLKSDPDKALEQFTK